MRFVDQAKVKVIAGDGGNGSVAFRREKYVPFGGPSGGDGGRGADVIFVGDEGMSTLLDFTHVRTIVAPNGEQGHGKDAYGRGGTDREERVPVGTQIRDLATGQLLADVTEHGQKIIVAKGGKGGRGNIHFATPHDRAPRRAEDGETGETRELQLTLKVIADAGLLGFPNVGKSTLVAAVSAARPKIADYPFTTLAPMLGVVEIGGGARLGGTNFVIADIPGLIPGASEGIGLGTRFLQHVERTRVLLHLVTLDPTEGREPLADYRALRHELERYSPELATRPEIVALSKSDLTEVKEGYPALKERFARAKIELRLVSAATREGLDALMVELFRITRGAVEDVAPPPLASAIVLPEEEAARAAGKKPTAKVKMKPVAKAKAKKPLAKAKAKKPVVKAKAKRPAPKLKAKARRPAPKAKAKAKRPAPKTKAKKPLARKPAARKKPVAAAKKPAKKRPPARKR